MIGIEADPHSDVNRDSLRRLGADPTLIPKMEASMVHLAKKLIADDPLVGAIVLACTDMPTYAAAIQRAVNDHLPTLTEEFKPIVDHPCFTDILKDRMG